MLDSSFTVLFYINNENTYALENVPLDKVWDESIPGEAMRSDPGNRWHVMMKYAANAAMNNLGIDSTLTIAYQDVVIGHDNEKIVVMRTK